MSFLDMISMSAGNLWRRKLRTILTVLGVLIGATSIITMLSLAIGMKKQMLESYESYGSITEIEVRGGDDMGSNGSGQLNKDTLLSDTNMETFSQMEYVKKVCPVLEYYGYTKIGKYTGSFQVLGVDKEELAKQKLAKGELPGAGGNKLEVIAGNSMLTSFYYKRGDEMIGYWDNQELPDIDLMKQLRKVEMYMDTYDGSSEENSSEETTSDTEGDSTEDTSVSSEYVDPDISTTAPTQTNNGQIEFPIQVTGMMEGKVDDYSYYSQSLLTDIDQLKAYLIRKFGKNNIPEQPKDNGKPLNEWVYNSFKVEVDRSEHVEEVQKAIQDMGFSASSNKDMIDSMNSSMQMVELVLGGIGMVAFLVAAIGIANTMMMSTYERTKEIGVMKVLGCDMRDIKKLFLSEAAFIGFVGGMVGLFFSIAISHVINNVASKSVETGDMQISLITWWLALAAVGFSTFMGIVAGYFPARRAMKLSPLAAIRTE